MSIFSAFLACCCGTDTPATDCPPEPCLSATVSVSITANPVACNNVDSVTCETCGDSLCFTNVKGCTCDEQHALLLPNVAWQTGLGPATVWTAWCSYYDHAPYPECIGTPSTFVDCGSSQTEFDGPIEGSISASFDCGAVDGFGDCSGTPQTSYFPDFASYDGGNGMMVTVKGCCCENCNCGGTKCSLVYVDIVARWTVEHYAPVFGYAMPPYYVCDCGDDSQDAVDVNFATGTSSLLHEQTASLVFERVIYTSQSDCRLAPGAYTLRSATLVNPMAKCWIGGAYVQSDLTCGFTNGELFQATTDPYCDTSGACGKSSLAAAGWNVSVTVAA